MSDGISIVDESIFHPNSVRASNPRAFFPIRPANDQETSRKDGTAEQQIRS
jgi:hypothetical protein